jgi:hypothetical protein
MREILSDRLGRFMRGTGITAIAALCWAVLVPGGSFLFWSAILAAGLIGAAVATAVLVRNRSIPSLAQVIAIAEDEPVGVPARGGYTRGAGSRPRGDREP